MTPKKKTMLVERNRTQYARSHGDSTFVRVDEPLGIDLELPTSYAESLLASLRQAIASGDEFENALISLDVPVHLHLRPTQVEQLITLLAKVTS